MPPEPKPGFKCELCGQAHQEKAEFFLIKRCQVLPGSKAFTVLKDIITCTHECNGEGVFYLP